MNTHTQSKPSPANRYTQTNTHRDTNTHSLQLFVGFPHESPQWKINVGGVKGAFLNQLKTAALYTVVKAVW